MKKKVEIEKIYPLSPMQEGMLFHTLANPGSTAYFEQNVFRIDGDIDIPLLEKSFNRIVQRYDVFRTIFKYEKLKQPLQILLKERQLKMHFEDISHLPGNQHESYLEQFKQEDRQRGFNLAKDMLLRVSLFKTGEKVYLLVWDFHHILMDGWCIGIIFKELARIYQALTQGKPIRLETVTPYWKYIQWLTMQNKEKGLLFWKNALDGYDRQSFLPRTNMVPKEGGYRLMEHCFDIESQLKEGLEKIAGENQVTVNIVFQTLWGILLMKYNDTRDVVFGAVVSGRPAEIEGIEGMVGLFINTIPVRVQMPTPGSFLDILHRVRETSSASKDYEYLQLAEVQANSPLPRGLFDHILIFENYLIQEELGQTSEGQLFKFNVQTLDIFEQTNYDFNIIILPAASYRVRLSFNSLVYDADFVTFVGHHFTEIIKQIVGKPHIVLEDISILSADEKILLLYDINCTNTPYPSAKTIHRLFEEQVAKGPDHTSVAGGAQNMRSLFAEKRSIAFDSRKWLIQITYGKLDEISDRLARLLQQKGVQLDTIMAIMMERCLEMIVAIMGILKAGGAYLPVDPGYPEERIDYMLKDSGAEILLKGNDFIPEASNICPKGTSSRLHLPLEPATSLAYIIYTSGTTGKPKGTLVEHRNVVQLMFHHNHPFDFKNTDAWTMFHSYCFDFSVWEMYGALLYGGKLILITKMTAKDPIKFLQVLKKECITVLNQTPTAFFTLVNEELTLLDTDKAKELNLRYVIFGGEALMPVKLKKWKSTYPEIRLVNMFGITETTVHVTYKKVGHDEIHGNINNIGKPIPTSSAFVMDTSLNLLPPGIPGELCVGGAGVARGYLNRVPLTAEKFIKNPYQRGETLYRSGDMVKLLGNHEMLYLGRIDLQVKIRGHRIEVGEIESHLMQRKGIKEARVIAMENETGDKYLCAYIVPGDQSIVSSTAAQWREYLAKSLPSYMIPSYFVKVDKFPLTPNGKLDSSSLPDPVIAGLESGIEYATPRNEIERKLVEIWASMLVREHISIHDDFFMIGGDSIKSLQVASRMNREGYKIKVKDILEHPTISALAPHVKTDSLTAEQGLISGSLPLTPIQAEFFHNNLTAPHHYNHALMLFSSLQDGGGFEPEAIKTIFSKLWQHHDALRLTFKKEPQGIIQTNDGRDSPFSISVYDYRHQHQQDALKQLERTANKIQASFDLEKGPLMKVAISQLEEGSRLLVVIHHLVIDGVSWRILLEDIDTLYRQYKKGEPMQLPPKTDSFKKWAEKLSRFANCDSFLKEKSYWAELESTAEKVPAIAKDFEEEDNYYKDAHSLSISLSKTETQRLLTKTNQAFGTEINDILLTALGLGMKKTWGHNRFIIALEGHGREDIINDVDITRTVGWFTCIYPIQLDVSMGDNWERQIKEIKEELRRVPNKGIGWGILKYLTQPQHKEGIRLQFTPQVKFNYLGQLDSDVHKRSFAVARESVGDSISPEAQRENQIDVVGIISGGKLLISITYSKKQYKTDTIRMLLENYQSALTTIISYCCSRKERVLTPSDLTYKGLSIAMVDRLRARFPHLEDIYPLSPMQEGMLFHSLDRKNRTTYFQQVSYRLHGHLDRYLVEKSLNELFKRHDILRTVFVYSEVDTPLQAVLEDRRVDFYYQDLRKMAEEDREEFIRQFKEKDKKRPFDLNRDVLMRVSILQPGESAYEFTWSFHHIIMDGWCINILIAEFQEIYHSFSQNKPYRLQEVTPYREYIKWLDKQESDHTLKYWEKYLSGYEGELSLSKKKQKARDVAQYKNERISITLDREISIRLNRLLVQNKITLNTIFTTVWGILLGIYKGKQDVVFGMVVSGRPAQIKGIESMVGLFINTIPFRVKYQPKTTVKELLMRVQENVIQQEPHQYYPLAKILGRVHGKKLLIDHILDFVNYPTADRIDGLVKQDKNKEIREPRIGSNLMLINASTYEQSHYDLNLEIVTGNQVVINMLYNGNIYEKQFLQRMFVHIRHIIEEILKDLNMAIDEISIMSQADRNMTLKKLKNKKNKLWTVVRDLEQDSGEIIEENFDF